MTTLNAGEGKVDFLAEAIAKSDGFISLMAIPNSSRDLYRRRVVALLTALRTPSDEMVEAMGRVWTGSPYLALHDNQRRAMADAFTSAIDVLLTPKDPTQ